MSDLGHARVPADFLAQVWAVMAVTPQHTYQILSKRPHRLSRVLLDSRFEADVRAIAWQLDGHSARQIHWPLPNVWMGASIELDRYCPRADSLRETPAAVQFLSLERPCSKLLPCITGPVPRSTVAIIDGRERPRVQGDGPRLGARTRQPLP